MLVPGPPVGPGGDAFVARSQPPAQPLYWLRLDRVGPKRRQVVHELRRLDPCLSWRLARSLLKMAESGFAGEPVYIAGALSAREAAASTIRLSRAGARVKVIETLIP